MFTIPSVGGSERRTPFVFRPLYAPAAAGSKRVYNTGPDLVTYDSMDAAVGTNDNYRLRRVAGGFEYERLADPASIADNLHRNWIRFAIPFTVPKWAATIDMSFSFDANFTHVPSSWQQCECYIGTGQYSGAIPKISGPHASLMYWYTGYDGDGTASGSRQITGSAVAYREQTLYLNIDWLPRDRSGYAFRMAYTDFTITID
jgi:hypothetical protein